MSKVALRPYFLDTLTSVSYHRVGLLDQLHLVPSMQLKEDNSCAMF